MNSTWKLVDYFCLRIGRSVSIAAFPSPGQSITDYQQGKPNARLIITPNNFIIKCPLAFPPKTFYRPFPFLANAADSTYWYSGGVSSIYNIQ